MPDSNFKESTYYELWYWGYYDSQPECTQLLRKPVIVPEETRKQMLSGNARFYRFIIDDGEEMIVARECVHSLRQLYEKEVW